MKHARLWAALLALTLLIPSLAAAAAAQNNFYIIPDSDTRLLTEEELWDWQYEAVGYIYNEIFARHGRPFRSGEKYDVYFRNQQWYSVNSAYRYGLLSRVEQANEQLAHKVLQDMRAQNTTNPKGRPLPRSNAEAASATVLNFRAYDLKPNQKLEVYSGPGTQYYRSANGKASVSTNGTVWIAGRDGGWLAIAYETNGGSRRIGYIDMSRLKDGLTAPSLALDNAHATVVRACGLTDEPDGSCKELLRLNAGDSVQILGPYTSRINELWLYVEAQGQQPVRGFIPAGAALEDEPAYDWDDEAGYAEGFENG